MNKQKLKENIKSMQIEIDRMKEELNKKGGLWMPDEGERYWVVLPDGRVDERNNIDPNMTKKHFEIGAYKTEQEAQAAVDRQKLKVRILNTIAELNDGWEPDWSDAYKVKFLLTIRAENVKNRTENVAEAAKFATIQVAKNGLYLRSMDAVNKLKSQYTPEELRAAYWA